jgi:transcriptional regulator with XRE-family HTH domain
MTIDFVEFGKYLRQKREDVNLSQGEVARKLDYSTAQFVSNWERGLAAPPADKMKRLVTLLEIPEDEIIDMLSSLSVRYWTHKIRGRLTAKRKVTRR